MKLNIGENIKRLRKERDLTQEELAEMLGVSCQSVSRWENNLCYPDIELIPTIAATFEISTDQLIGVDEIIEKNKVKEYQEKFQNAVSVGNVDECIRIARQGVSEYPNNFILLNMLMYALFISGDDTGNIPEWKENMEKYDAEIVALGERIMKYCPNQELRLEATARLAFQHCEMGRKSIGRSIYETLPGMHSCRENEIWWGLEKDEQLPFLRGYIRKCQAYLDEAMFKLATNDLLPEQDAQLVFEKMFELEKLIFEDNSFAISWTQANRHYYWAKSLMRLEKADEAIEHLKLAAKAVIDFDNRPEVQEHHSLLLGTVVYKRNDFETADSRPIHEIMRDTWLAAEEFKSICDTEKFKAVIKILS